MVCRPKNLSYTIPSNMPFVAIFLCMFCEAIFYEHIFIRSNVLHLLICLDVGPRTPVRKKKLRTETGWDRNFYWRSYTWYQNLWPKRECSTVVGYSNFLSVKIDISTCTITPVILGILFSWPLWRFKNWSTTEHRFLLASFTSISSMNGGDQLHWLNTIIRTMRAYVYVCMHVCACAYMSEWP